MAHQWIRRALPKGEIRDASPPRVVSPMPGGYNKVVPAGGAVNQIEKDKEMLYGRAVPFNIFGCGSCGCEAGTFCVWRRGGRDAQRSTNPGVARSILIPRIA